MRRIANPNTPLPKAPELEPLASIADISVARLIDDGLICLQREMKNIKSLSVSGKLDAATARDLRDHVKLLFELNVREKDLISDMTDEELEAAAKQILAEIESRKKVALE